MKGNYTHLGSDNILKSDTLERGTLFKFTSLFWQKKRHAYFSLLTANDRRQRIIDLFIFLVAARKPLATKGLLRQLSTLQLSGAVSSSSAGTTFSESVGKAR